MQNTVDYDALCDAFDHIGKERNGTNVENIKYEEKLRSLLVPKYHWIFLHIGRIEHGVKFLVDLRTEIRVSFRTFTGFLNIPGQEIF